MPVRKAGKLPRVAASRSYDLEYGTATLELPADAVEAGARVFVIDDVLATGGTAVAACDLVIAAGAEVVGFAAMIELVDLGGRARLGAIPVHALLAYSDRPRRHDSGASVGDRAAAVRCGLSFERWRAAHDRPATGRAAGPGHP